MLREILLLVQICGTPPGFAADTLDCALEDLLKPQQIAKVRLWRALRWSYEHPVAIDSLGATTGLEVCFTVPDTLQATYWIQVVNSEGIGSCLGPGLSIPQTVGVGYPSGESVGPGEEERYYDLSGRRLPTKPTQPGIYWLKPKGKAARRILVFVKTLR